MTAPEPNPTAAGNGWAAPDPNGDTHPTPTAPPPDPLVPLAAAPLAAAPLATVPAGPPSTLDPGLPWGPPAPRARKPWGLWVPLGALFTGLLLSTVGAVAGATFVVLTGTGGLSRFLGGNTTEELATQVTDLLTTGPALFGSLVGLWTGLFALPVLVSRSKGSRSVASDFGLRFRRTDPLIGLAAAVALTAAEVGLSAGLKALGVDLTGSDNAKPILDQTGPWLVVLCAATALGAPFFEEFFFRGTFLGAMMRRLTRPIPGPSTGNNPLTRFVASGWNALRFLGRFPGRLVGPVARSYPRTVSVVVTSTVFGSLHAQSSGAGLIWIVALTGLIGAALGTLALRFGRLGPSICAHVTFNTIALALAFASR